MLDSYLQEEGNKAQHSMRKTIMFCLKSSLLDSVVSRRPEEQHHLQAKWNQGRTYCVPWPGRGLISWLISYTFGGLGQVHIVLRVYLSVLDQGWGFVFPLKPVCLHKACMLSCL